MILLRNVSIFWSTVQENSEESLYFEAFDKVLESWMKFVEHVDDLPANTLLHHAVEIFTAYIRCHLAQPDGSRNIVCKYFFLFSVGLS